MPRLATAEQLREHLASQVKAEDAPILTVVLESAESFVERFCGRRFSPDPELVSGEDIAPSIEKAVIVSPEDRLVRIPDLRELVGLTLGGLTLDSSDFKLGNYSPDSPANQIELLQTAAPSLSSPETELIMKGRFGFNPTPPDIVDAVLTIAARRYRERDAAFSDTLQMAEGGLLTYFRSLPSNVQLILRSYKLPRIAVIAPPREAVIR